jgi:hypothetical protein
MTRTWKILAIISWILAALGGGWTMLTMLSAYMTTTGYIQVEDMVSALPLPLTACLLALAVHLWPRSARLGRIWPWCVPVYVVAGGPLLLIVNTWLEQRYNK